MPLRGEQRPPRRSALGAEARRRCTISSHGRRTTWTRRHTASPTRAVS
ncbi:hypothetical protein D187_002373 [Cystobacter fuscus DSM 2262]|uniref:Uncharacterized protein n=1 Tax=Cystobacter fuscus (strain ATCC 25194 / DSM 2262 / NBRC 100088 / M29) TaxID=1242864 RepID=S9PDB2_CYSF2|nr:hypothetical protein D187_002373 [Cystobacter fuscus DSM 2262]